MLSLKKIIEMSIVTCVKKFSLQVLKAYGLKEKSYRRFGINNNINLYCKQKWLPKSNIGYSKLIKTSSD